MIIQLGRYNSSTNAVGSGGGHLELNISKLFITAGGLDAVDCVRKSTNFVVIVDRRLSTAVFESIDHIAANVN